MKKKNNWIVIGLILLFLVCGYTIFLYGIRNGQSISINLTKPIDHCDMWTTSEVQTNLTMYGICAFGGLWIIVSHVLFILLIAKNLITSDNSTNIKE